MIRSQPLWSWWSRPPDGRRGGGRRSNGPGRPRPSDWPRLSVRRPVVTWPAGPDVDFDSLAAALADLARDAQPLAVLVQDGDAGRQLAPLARAAAGHRRRAGLQRRADVRAAWAGRGTEGHVPDVREAGLRRVAGAGSRRSGGLRAGRHSRSRQAWRSRTARKRRRHGVAQRARDGRVHAARRCPASAIWRPSPPDARIGRSRSTPSG